MKLYKLFLPGLSGIAQFLAAFILLLKGYKVIGMQPMDLPSNWISLHPGLRKKVVDSIFARCKRKTIKFAGKILTGKKVYTAFWSLPFDLAVAPVSLAYYLAGRFAIAKTFVANFNCNQCMRCVNDCPVKAVIMVDNRPFWTFNCESCMHCMNYCPNRAIETALSYTILIWWFVFSALPVWLIHQFIKWDWFSINIKPIWLASIKFLIQTLVGLIIIFFAYRLLHYLMRFRFFNKLIIYTSPSHYKFWRRYKAPKDV
jgi:Pyruvate/2-oxoacid:ferredoxin oxidoreductase delta subunit